MGEEIKKIAVRIKELREIEESSVEDLCASLSVDPLTYEKYESGNIDIPISFLYELASYYNVALLEILSGDAPKLQIYQAVKNGKGLKVERSKQYDYQSLAFNFKNKKAEPFVVTVSPNSEKSIPKNTHSGQEFDYMLEGRLLISINNTEIVLEAGDSIYYDSGYPHGMKALDDKEARFLAVIF